jgi:hypothetical protein
MGTAVSVDDSDFPAEPNVMKKYRAGIPIVRKVEVEQNCGMFYLVSGETRKAYLEAVSTM